MLHLYNVLKFEIYLHSYTWYTERVCSNIVGNIKSVWLLLSLLLCANKITEWYQRTKIMDEHKVSCHVVASDKINLALSEKKNVSVFCLELHFSLLWTCLHRENSNKRVHNSNAIGGKSAMITIVIDSLFGRNLDA